MIKLEDKLYTSTEVADILGVSLRSVYRYIEEDKLHAEVKTATGRHRFTKQDILNFLYPEGYKEEGEESAPKIKVSSEVKKDEEPAEVKTEPEPKIEKASDDDSVDWLSKFREAAKKFQEEESVSEAAVEAVAVKAKAEGITGLGGTQPAKEAEEAKPDPAPEPEKEEEKGPQMKYYKSGLGGLKDIAQNLDKSAREEQAPYAFTLNAGLSLHSPIKPFSLLHSYVRKEDVDYFEKKLQLSEVKEDDSQLCLIITDDLSILKDSEELHGLFVVDKKQLAEDIQEIGDKDLQEEASGLLK